MRDAEQSGDAGLVRIRRALISVSDKTGLEPLVRALHKFDVEIISTGGTARAIEALGVPVTPVEAVTGFPEILGGRVKTLHPAIHAAILADRDNPDHMAELETHGIEPIDLVVVNLYPFEETAAKEGVTEEELIEQIDIGGVALLRAAAKNHKHVCVLALAESGPSAIQEIIEEGGSTTSWLRQKLQLEALTLTSDYDTAIVGGLMGLRYEDARWTELRYGENPHQTPAYMSSQIDFAPSGPPTVGGARKLCGKALSYNNYLDSDRAVDCALDLARLGVSAACVVKHGNPCGAGIGPTLNEAIKLGLRGDPLAAYGGVIALSSVCDITAARVIVELAGFIEVVLAPNVAPDAAEHLSGKWPNVRVLAIGGDRRVRAGENVEQLESSSRRRRWIRGGMLEQPLDDQPMRPAAWVHAAGPAVGDSVRRASALSVACAKHLTSNAIAIGGPDPDEDTPDGADPSAVRLFGGGCGQQDRVWACRIAAEKAKDSIARARAKDLPVIAASDAFFPFPDGPELLIDAGVTVIVHPGGSKRDQETFDLCERRGVTCLTTGVRHFRH